MDYYTLTIDGKDHGTAKVSGWGSAPYARGVFGLGRTGTRKVREAVRDGQQVLLHGCPRVGGETRRRIVERAGRLVTRMPAEREVAS